MRKTIEQDFEHFAEKFVRNYWKTVKSNAFPMAPDEPVEETIEELLSRISHETKSETSSRGVLHKVRMTDTFGGWWLFVFRRDARGWNLNGALAISLDPEHPHDLLGLIYGGCFKPFLRHVTDITNASPGA